MSNAVNELLAAQMRDKRDGETDCEHRGHLVSGGACLRCGAPEVGVATTGPRTPIVPLTAKDRDAVREWWRECLADSP